MRNRAWRPSNLLLLGLLLLLISGCAQNTGAPPNQSNNNPALDETSDDPWAKELVESEATSEDVAESGSVQKIDIANNAFSPASLLVKAGTKVIWTNLDDVNHEIRADDDAYMLDIIGKDGQVEMVFSTPGTFDYRCHLYPFMKGRIIVE